MGGLVSRYFLECLEGWKDTRALVTFGTPYRGSLNALDGLANGVKKGPLDLSTLARQLTALYQLLPVYECYDAGDGKLVRVGETAGIPNVDAAKAADGAGLPPRDRGAVASNQQAGAVPVRRAIASTRSLASRSRPTCLRVWPAASVADAADLQGRSARRRRHGAARVGHSDRAQHQSC